MKTTAKLKYLHISPRKVRLVADLIKGMDVEEARFRLQLLTKRAAQPLLKLLNSAVASVKHNHNLEEKNLYISKIIVNQGPTFKRWRARARGMASPIMKRSSHVILELAETATTKARKRQKRKKTATTKSRKGRKPREVSRQRKARNLKKRPKKKLLPTKERVKKIGKKIFRRKSF